MAEADLATIQNGPYAKLLVADEFRLEEGGKMLAIGLYSDGVVVLTIPKNAPLPTKETPVGFDGVALLLTIGGVVGTTTIRFGMEGGRTFEKSVTLQEGSSANLVLNAKPFRIGAFGVKHVVVEVEGTTHRLPFEIRAKYIEPVDDLDSYVSIRHDYPASALPSVEPAAVVTKAARKRRPKSDPK